MNMTPKQVNDAVPLDLDRCHAASDKQRTLSRRSQALLAAAGMDEPHRHWFVVTVATGKDANVAERFAASNICCWSAFELVKPKRRGGMKGGRGLVTRLAFPGYVFIRVAATDEAFMAISAIKGVTGLLGFDGRPARLQDDVIETVRLFLEGHIDVSHALSEGDRAEITDGPFVGHKGTVARINEKGFALMEILLFGRLSPVTLDLADIKKL